MFYFNMIGYSLGRACAEYQIAYGNHFLSFFFFIGECSKNKPFLKFYVTIGDALKMHVNYIAHYAF